jgi:hypothetical protein
MTSIVDRDEKGDETVYEFTVDRDQTGDEKGHDFYSG